LYYISIQFWKKKKKIGGGSSTVVYKEKVLNEKNLKDKCQGKPCERPVTTIVCIK